MNDKENMIRERARRLWEEAGCPDGRDEEFWHAAERQIAEEQGGARNGKNVSNSL